MKTAITRISAVLFMSFLMATVALAQQDSKAVVGNWNMTSESSEGPIHWVLVIKSTDGKLTATLKTPQESEAPARDFTFVDGVVKFQAPYQDNYYDIELKLVDNKLDGTWSGDGDSGHTYGVKAGA
jgi:hypothetical protein